MSVLSSQVSEKKQPSDSLKYIENCMTINTFFVFFILDLFAFLSWKLLRLCLIGDKEIDSTEIGK